jgi:TPP-dependent indolepyruvate ferredoxin oxidoreductase alpha subunit
MNIGCPALTREDGIFEGRQKVKIHHSLCIGCTLRLQVCTVDCIKPASSRHEIGDLRWPQDPDILSGCRRIS